MDEFFKLIPVLLAKGITGYIMLVIFFIIPLPPTVMLMYLAYRRGFKFAGISISAPDDVVNKLGIPITYKILKDHPLFRRIRFYKSQYILQYSAIDPAKTIMIRHSLHDLLESMLDHFFAAVEGDPTAIPVYGNDSGLSSVFIDALDRVRATTEIKLRERGIPVEFSDRFLTWLFPFEESLRESIERISNTRFFGQDGRLTYVTLEIILSHIDLLFGEVDIHLRKLNGDLNGLEYRGMIVGNGAPKHVRIERMDAK
jgi:hypothetical protein